MEGRIDQSRSGKKRPIDRSVREIRVVQVGVVKVAPPEACIDEVGTAKIRAAELRSSTRRDAVLFVSGNAGGDVGCGSVGRTLDDSVEPSDDCDRCDHGENTRAEAE